MCVLFRIVSILSFCFGLVLFDIVLSLFRWLRFSSICQLDVFFRSVAIVLSFVDLVWAGWLITVSVRGNCVYGLRCGWLIRLNLLGSPGEGEWKSNRSSLRQMRIGIRLTRRVVPTLVATPLPRQASLKSWMNEINVGLWPEVLAPSHMATRSSVGDEWLFPYKYELGYSSKRRRVGESSVLMEMEWMNRLELACLGLAIGKRVRA